MKRFIQSSALLGIYLSAAFIPAWAAEPKITDNPHPPIERLLAAASPEIFQPDEKGGARHVQSGFVCPPNLVSSNLWHLQVFESPMGLGTDIGCDYGRLPPGATKGNAEAKYTIFLVKAETGTTLDSAFKRYQAELMRANPRARATGPALTVETKDGAKSDFPDFRSEEYDISLGGHPYVDQLYVTLIGGWIIEVRATYPKEVTGEHAMFIAQDLAAGAHVWMTLVVPFSKQASAK